MRILVCIKQKGEDGDIHRFDTHALEEALVLKDQPCNKIPDPVMVDVVTAGMLRAEKIIRRAFGMGADKGFHIITEDTYYTSSFMTASRLSVVAEKTPYDLILTGVMSEDMMAGQTGPMLARIMGLPCATGVVKVCLHPMDNKVTIEREMENGLRESLVILLPAVLTIQAGINTPRYPSLSNMLKADKKKLQPLMQINYFLNRSWKKKPVSPWKTLKKQDPAIYWKDQYLTRLNRYFLY